MYCQKCGRKINNDSLFCNYCGETIEVEEPEDGIIDKEFGVYEIPEEDQKAPSIVYKVNRLPLMITLAVIIVLVIVTIVTYPNYKPYLDYNKAMTYFKSGDYIQAETAFSEIGEFKDSADMIKESKYNQAKKLFDNGEYDRALETYKELEGYKDSDSLLEKSKYKYALYLLYNGNKEGARNILFLLKDVSLFELLSSEISGHINNSYVLKNPKIGMKSQEVLNSTWGRPKDINKTTNKYGVREQWVYSNNRYIYLVDGIVTSISE